jgi:hypothetical protein
MESWSHGRPNPDARSFAPCTTLPPLVSSFFALLAFFRLRQACGANGFAAIPALDLQPLGVEYPGFVGAFVSMCAEIIALSL